LQGCFDSGILQTLIPEMNCLQWHDLDRFLLQF